METNTTIRINIDTYDIKVNQDVEVLIKETKRYYCVYCIPFRALGYSRDSLIEATRDLESNIETTQWVHFKRGTLKEALIKFGWVNTTGDNYEYKP